MADEYFYIEEISQNLSDTNNAKLKPKMKDPEPDNTLQTLSPKKSQEIRLHEIEQQLEMAESRCNTLKGQVDYMKMLYNGMNNQEGTLPTSKPSITPSFKRESMNCVKRKKAWESGDTKITFVPRIEDIPSRDVDLNGKTISTLSTIPHRDVCSKDANEAVKSINNIISGITNSVNRLTQLQVNMAQTDTQITSESIGIQNIECLPRGGAQDIRPEKPYQEATATTKTKFKGKKTVKKDGVKGSKLLNENSIASVENTKKFRSVSRAGDKKLKIAIPTTSPGFRKKAGKLNAIASRTLLSKRSLNYLNSSNKTAAVKTVVKSPYFKTDKLVELYHNSKVKIPTASDESVSINKKSTNIFPKCVNDVLKKNKEAATTIYEKIEEETRYRNPLTPIEETEKNTFTPAPYYKNYELPTIASKMKQVARTYFENFNFRTIPFVAARSISPSHNLGVNIQQVLSIIKGRKPVAGISPTLAYNIELAATKLGSRPLSCLVSTLGSRMNSRTCPLNRHFNNMSALQELAKEIPEETVEELNEECSNTERLATGPLAAGDKPEHKTWSAEPNAKTDKCTCAPKQGTGVAFQEVYNKCITQKFTPKPPLTKKLRNRPWNANTKFNRSSNLIGIESKTSTMTKKEKSLKEILKNLYEEFSSLNNRYEELKKEVNKGSTASKHLLQEIENMETILQNKEDEITMVMSLYKEVMALKQQVMVLKKRASQSTVIVNPFVNRQREYKEMNAAGHLTKLLRHIQQFQGSLKNKTS